MVELADIHPQKSQQLHTSIRITTDGLSFYARDKESSALLVSFSTPFPESTLSLSLSERVKEVLFLHTPLSLPFHSTKIFVEPLEVMLMPEELSQKSTLGFTQHALTEDAEEKKELILRIPHNGGMAMSFSMDEPLYSLGLRSFSNPSYHHILAELIRQSVEASLTTGSKVVHAAFSGGSLNVAAAEQGKLLLGNSVIAPRAEDAIYHLTRIWRGLGMNAHNDSLTLWAEGADSPTLSLYFGERIKEYTAHTSPEEICHLYLQ